MSQSHDVVSSVQQHEGPYERQLTENLVWRCLRNVSPEKVRLVVRGKISSLVETETFLSSSDTFAALCAAVADDHLVYVQDVQHDGVIAEALLSDHGHTLLDRGIPKGPVDLEIFAGRYRATPGGIHRESCSNFHAVVAGEKTFYFWETDSAILAHADRSDKSYDSEGRAEEYLEGVELDAAMAVARAVVVGPGGAVSWPHWSWHLAAAPRTCLSVNTTLYPDGDGLVASHPVIRLWSGQVTAPWVRSLYAFMGWSGDVQVPDALRFASTAGLKMAARAPGLGADKATRACRRATRAPAIWFRDADRLIVSILGQSILCAADAVRAAEWLGSGDLDEFIPTSKDERHLLMGLLDLGLVHTADA